MSQFRPPLGRFSLELPAGLVDTNETPMAAALRELREETGWTGTPPPDLDQTNAHPGQDLAVDPGMTAARIGLVVVDVDLDLPENQNPQQELDVGEYVTVHTVPWPKGGGVVQHVWELAARLDADVDARLGAMLMALEFLADR